MCDSHSAYIYIVCKKIKVITYIYISLSYSVYNALSAIHPQDSSTSSSSASSSKPVVKAAKPKAKVAVKSKAKAKAKAQAGA